MDDPDVELLVVFLGLVCGLAVLFSVSALPYRCVPLSRVLVVYGRRRRAGFLKKGTRGWRAVRGGGVFVWPHIEQSLDLNLGLRWTEWTVEVAGASGVAGTSEYHLGWEDELILERAATMMMDARWTDTDRFVNSAIERAVLEIRGCQEWEKLRSDRLAFSDRIREVAGSSLREIGIVLRSVTVRAMGS
ncbi:hypothetical protein HZA57_07190 [Candidatus Poribacteria bacterium]|nr:hypothetical protein [Candidatus Poribacteria bacterium]